MHGSAALPSAPSAIPPPLFAVPSVWRRPCCARRAFLQGTLSSTWMPPPSCSKSFPRSEGWTGRRSGKHSGHSRHSSNHSRHCTCSQHGARTGRLVKSLEAGHSSKQWSLLRWQALKDMAGACWAMLWARAGCSSCRRLLAPAPADSPPAWTSTMAVRWQGSSLHSRRSMHSGGRRTATRLLAAAAAEQRRSSSRRCCSASPTESSWRWTWYCWPSG